MKISITNHTGSRNRGCEALVLSKIIGISNVIEGAEFCVHTNDPTYDAWRFSGRAGVAWSHLINTPNHFPNMALNKLVYGVVGFAERFVPKVKGVDLASVRHVRAADLVVASGGDIFTSDYGNLRKHLAYPLVANKKKLYLCSHSIGPFKGSDESYFLRAVDGVGAITARERETYDYLRSIDVQADVHFAADVAFTLPSLNTEAARHLLSQRYGLVDTSGLVALSVSQGIIKYSGLEHDAYYSTFARLCDALIDAGKKVILIPHVMEKNPDNNDVIACDEVLKRMTHLAGVVVVSGEPSAVDFKGIIGCCECLIGTRTHATIAAMSQGVPTVSIAYSRKAHGIMKDVYGDELGAALTVEARDITPQILLSAYEHAVASRIDSGRLAAVKERAQLNFTVAKALLS